jgi:hypothetical protein
MPEKATTQKAKRDLRAGKRPSTAASNFVREEIHHVREGKHGARSTKQAIAIGLSKARRAGVPLPRAPKRSTRTRPSTPGGKRAVSHKALSAQAKSVAKKRTHAQRSASAKKAARTRARLEH